MSLRQLIASCVAAVAVVGWSARGAIAQGPQASSIPADARANFASAWAQQPRVDMGIPAGGAKVVIVKFNDYECPSCRSAELAYKPVFDRIAKSNPGAVKYVVKDWPWNSACNFNTASTIHGHEASCNAAAAARMARDRGKLDEMVDWLWSNQGTSPAAVRDEAQKMLGIADFDAEYAKKLPEIRRDVADGGVLRVNVTPTFFINGVRLPDGMRAEYFELAIDLELKK